MQAVQLRGRRRLHLIARNLQKFGLEGGHRLVAFGIGVLQTCKKTIERLDRLFVIPRNV